MRNASHSLGHLNIWSPAGGSVGDSLGGMALLEEASH